MGLDDGLIVGGEYAEGWKKKVHSTFMQLRVRLRKYPPSAVIFIVLICCTILLVTFSHSLMVSNSSKSKHVYNPAHYSATNYGMQGNVVDMRQVNGKAPKYWNAPPPKVLRGSAPVTSDGSTRSKADQEKVHPGTRIVPMNIVSVQPGETFPKVERARNKVQIDPVELNSTPKRRGSQSDLERSRKQDTPENEDQKAIREMMEWAWYGYKKYAWGKDVFKPLSRTSEVMFLLGGTIIDSIDTLWIMGLTEQYEEARSWIEHELNVGVDKYEQLFECVIRCLGGLLSIHALTEDPMYLEKAKQLGYNLLPAFESSPTGMPLRNVNLKTGKVSSSGMVLAEVTTLQVEFKYLAEKTGEPRFAEAANKAMCAVQKAMPPNGLIPVNVEVRSGTFSGTITMGACGDSHYEYLLKQWLLTDRKEPALWDWYKLSMDSVVENMVDKTTDGHVYLAELSNSHYSRRAKMDHLACFAAGMLLLGHHAAADSIDPGFETANLEKHEKIGDGVMKTCSDMYLSAPTHLSPEFASFSADRMILNGGVTANYQRPETVESLFIFARLRWDRRKEYQEVGRTIYQAFEKYMRVSTGGYASLKNVMVIPDGEPNFKTHNDKMETFFLAETLKYLYLLFSDDPHFLHPGEHWVFNTEAHPLPVGLTSEFIAYSCHS
mmetsp:Transcript_10398/g.18741  ORF Transcript_10398/g.18741 Transcript_10398/m.18741 type:complete len:661 (-) Transcript_10398:1493-3475(-)